MKAFGMNNRGAALVEFAIVALLLFTLVFGILEFGMLIKDFLALNQASREGARSASLRSDYTVVVDRVIQSAATLDPARFIEVRPDYRIWNGASHTWNPWVEDAVPPDTVLQSNVQVRVHAEYQHNLITGAFFQPLFGQNYIVVRSDMVMKRE